MTARPIPRKSAAMAHVVASLGWLGAVAAFLALAIAGLTLRDPERVRATYLAMSIIYLTVIVPLGVAASLSGVLLSMITDWGLVRHYWLLIKSLMAIPLTVLMVVHGGPLNVVANAAAGRILMPDTFRGIRIELAIDSIMAVVALLGLTALSIYKPRGRTGLGR